jgi:hypothetical protein
MSWAGGAGALYSTVEDLYRWNEGIFNGRVLNEKSLKEAFTPVKVKESTGDDPESGYGYGWSISKLRGSLEIAHTGGLPGFRSILLRMPSDNFTVAILANSEPGTSGTEPNHLAFELVDAYLGDKLAPRPAENTNVSTKAFDAILGRYDYGRPYGIMTVSREGNHLIAQMLGQTFELFPKSETEFFLKDVDAEITFFKDDSGKIVRSAHHQNGRTINSVRLKDLVEAKLNPAVYDSLLGQYDYGKGQAILTVTREGNHLFAQLTDQPKLEIYPNSETEFFWKVVDAQVTFVKDEKGKVIKAIHHQNGGSFEAPRIASQDTDSK